MLPMSITIRNPIIIPKQRKIMLCLLFFIHPNECPIAKINGIKVKPTVSCPIEKPAKKLKI